MNYFSNAKKALFGESSRFNNETFKTATRAKKARINKIKNYMVRGIVGSKKTPFTGNDE